MIPRGNLNPDRKKKNTQNHGNYVLGKKKYILKKYYHVDIKYVLFFFPHTQ